MPVSCGTLCLLLGMCAPWGQAPGTCSACDHRSAGPAAYGVASGYSSVSIQDPSPLPAGRQKPDASPRVGSLNTPYSKRNAGGDAHSRSVLWPRHTECRDREIQGAQRQEKNLLLGFTELLGRPLWVDVSCRGQGGCCRGPRVVPFNLNCCVSLRCSGTDVAEGCWQE